MYTEAHTPPTDCLTWPKMVDNNDYGLDDFVKITVKQLGAIAGRVLTTASTL